MTPYLLLFGVGATEMFLIALVFLVLFGVDRIPEIARTIGRLHGRFDAMRREVQREMRSEEERADDERRAFERSRERHVRASLPEVQEEQRLRAAAEALGIDTAGMDAAALRSAIRDAAGNAPGSG